MHVGERILEIVGDVLVELVVLVLLDLVLGPSPKRGRAVDRFFALLVTFFVHLDGQRNMVGKTLDDGSKLETVEELVHVLAKVQHHLGAALGDLHVLDAEFALAV